MSGILNKIFSTGAKDITDSIGNVLDNVITSDEERLTAKNRLTKIVSEKLVQLASFQKEVLLVELNGSKLQRSWRPIVMLAFTSVVVYSKFIAPAFGLPTAELEPDFWELLKLGLGGYVVGRSLEKITEKVTENVDISLLKKRNRRA